MTIHLITAGKYENPDSWPPMWKHCYKSWEKCPYPIKKWNNRDINKLLREDDIEFSKLLDNLPPIYKWDYVRYIIFEKFGGAYFDMDIEIIDSSFFKKLKKDKIYLMEGTSGTHVENSIIISPFNKRNSEYWNRIKNQSKNNITLNQKECKDALNVVRFAGPMVISNFFIDHYISTSYQPYEILGYQQFGSKTNTISYTRHYQTSYWNQN
jgi:mannosyltransferase OCH1-like enzyme